MLTNKNKGTTCKCELQSKTNLNHQELIQGARAYRATMEFHVRKEVRQECFPSPPLFSLYTEGSMREVKVMVVMVISIPVGDSQVDGRYFAVHNFASFLSVLGIFNHLCIFIFLMFA